MKKELYIHIGLPKAGWSTINQSLRENLAAFSDKGVDVLMGNDIITQMGYHIITNAAKYWNGTNKCKFWDIIRELNPAVESFDIAEHQVKFFRDIGKRPYQKFIISNLMLANLLAPPGSPAFGFSAKLMRSFFQRNDVNVTIILVVRNQADFMASYYQEQFKHGETASFDVFFNEFLEYCNWKKLVESFETHFPEATIRLIPFRLAVVKTGFFKRFCMEIGIDDNSDFVEKIDNVGINPDLFPVWEVWNNRFSYTELKQLKNFIYKSAVDEKKNKKYFPFSDRQLEIIRETFHASNRELFDKYRLGSEEDFSIWTRNYMPGGVPVERRHNGKAPLDAGTGILGDYLLRKINRGIGKKNDTVLKDRDKTYEVVEAISTQMKSDNLLVEMRGGAIGWFFYQLIVGMEVFGKQSFDFLNCKVDLPHYTGYLEKIASLFKFCKGFHSFQLGSQIDIDLIVRLLKKKGKTVYIISNSDYLDYTNKNVKNIMFTIKDCFQFPREIIESDIGRQLKTDKFKICMLNRYCTIASDDYGTLDERMQKRLKIVDYYNPYNPDNVEYISWLQKEYDARIYIVGERLKNSTYYTPPDVLLPLKDIDNISFVFEDERTDILYDIYIMLHSDIHIAIAGGGLTWVAILFSKPVLVFDMLNSPEILKPNYNVKINGLHQLYSHTSLEEKKRITQTMMASLPTPGIETLWNNCNRQIGKLLNEIIIGHSADLFNLDMNWTNFDEAYFKLAGGFFEQGNIDRAVECIDRLDYYTLIRLGSEVYTIGRLFKDAGYFPMAIKCLNIILDWAKLKRHNGFAGAASFHLGDCYLQVKEFNFAAKAFQRCLAYIPDHKKARELYDQCIPRIKNECYNDEKRRN